MIYQYIVAGVRVISEHPIRGLDTQGCSDATTELHIRNFQRGDTVDCYLYPDKESPWACIRYDGTAIGLKRADAAMVRQTVPFAAALQGKITLHAAAVCYQERAYAFIGASGAGKSTLARAFAHPGLTVIADDLLACRIIDGQVVTLENQHPLAAVYFLRRNPPLKDWEFLALEKKQGLKNLIVHGFGELSVPAIWARQFLFYQQIITHVALYDLVVPDSLDRLTTVTAGLIAHWQATE